MESRTAGYNHPACPATGHLDQGPLFPSGLERNWVLPKFHVGLHAILQPFQRYHNSAFPMQISTIKPGSNCSCPLFLTLRINSFSIAVYQDGWVPPGNLQSRKHFCFPVINISLTTSVPSFFRFVLSSLIIFVLQMVKFCYPRVVLKNLFGYPCRRVR